MFEVERLQSIIKNQEREILELRAKNSQLLSEIIAFRSENKDLKRQIKKGKIRRRGTQS